MAGVELFFESTKSRSGLHAARRLAVRIVGGKVEVVDPAVSGARGTYSRGRAGYARVDPQGGYFVYVELVRDPRGRVKGRFTVYDSSGEPRLVAVLRNRKIRRSQGDPRLGWVVEAAVAALGLSGYVKRFNWNTGGG